jgi:probable HAF family extracellular repeat protein
MTYVDFSKPVASSEDNALDFLNSVLTCHGSIIALIPLLMGLVATPTAWAVPSYTVIDLGTLGGNSSRGQAINDRGQVTGISRTSSGEDHAFLYDHGTMTDLGTLRGSDRSDSEGWGINNNGQVSSGYYNHAFLYDHGTMTDLGTLGGNYSEGRDINDNSQVTGISTTSSGETHAFLYDHGAMTDLNTLGGDFSESYGINNSGQVTGGSVTSIIEYHAFLYEDGTMYDLNHLVTNLAGVGFSRLSWGSGINNHGQIVGVGEATNSYDHAFLATPSTVPLPSSAALLSLGLVVLGVVHRHRSRRQI